MTHRVATIPLRGSAAKLECRFKAMSVLRGVDAAVDGVEATFASVSAHLDGDERPVGADAATSLGADAQLEGDFPPSPRDVAPSEPSATPSEAMTRAPPAMTRAGGTLTRSTQTALMCIGGSDALRCHRRQHRRHRGRHRRHRSTSSLGSSDIDATGSGPDAAGGRHPAIRDALTRVASALFAIRGRIHAIRDALNRIAIALFACGTGSDAGDVALAAGERRSTPFLTSV